MTDERDELLPREEAAWAGFSALAVAIPVEKRDLPELRDGWSPTGVLWHVGAWMERAAGKLEEMVAGTWVPEPIDLDERNAQLLEESRAVAWDEAWSRLAAARGRIRPAFAELPEVDDDARGYFVNDTIEHYAEHGADLAALTGAPS